MDEIQRLEDLASAATTGHWPPHLLAPFDDKVQVLGKALGEAAETIAYYGDLEAENRGLETERGDLQEEIAELQEEIKELKAKLPK